MYTVVVLAALGGNAELPACWGRGYDYSYGCYGGWGYGYGYGGWGRGWRGYSGWGDCCYNYSPCVYTNSYYVPYASRTYAYPAVAAADAKSPATIVVNLPGDARLMIQDEPTKATSGQRTFTSPPLEPGKTFSYTLRADLDRNGEKMTVTRDVEVRAGQVSRISLDFPTRTARK
jgi:uncharacterized protein (TIGR03000 family)